VSFTARNYDEIVRDLLTTLTGGTTRETVAAPAEGSLVVPQKLLRRPVRRVSHMTGRIRTGPSPDAPQIDYRFTTQDFELITSSGRPDENDTIRFREEGRRPIPGSLLTVNYYPLHTDPVPLTDVNVGSVARTLMETFGRELALLQQQLERVYDSAFLDTAEGSSLDRVVAIVGVNRVPTGHPVTTVTFSRQTGPAGRITIPAGTAVSDANGNRYRTLVSLTMEPNETSGEVLAGGDSPGTPEVEAGAIDRLEILIAGVSGVTNTQPSRRLAVPESDDDLRRRTRGALHASVRGTLEALRFGLLSIPGVKDVAIEEEPNDVPGEIRVTLAFTESTPAVQEEVARVIEQLRPAGIRVLQGEAGRRRIGLRAELMVAGAGLDAAATDLLVASVEDELAAFLDGIAPGGKVRRSQLTSLAMADPNVVDAKVVLLPDGEAETEELQLGSSETIELVTPFTIVTVAEQSSAGPASASTVTALLPVHLESGVTEADATSSITTALRSHLTTRAPGAALTFDSAAAAIRDETRFGLIREEASLTVETGDGRFLQLTDGAGSYEPGVAESLQLAEAVLDVREGSV
jgi:uncharacterized phage protein gp47/JayE